MKSKQERIQQWLLGFENLFNKTKLDRIWETTPVFPWNVPQVSSSHLCVCVCVCVCLFLEKLNEKWKRKVCHITSCLGVLIRTASKKNRLIDWNFIFPYFSEASGDCTGAGLLWDMMFQCVFNTFHHISKAMAHSSQKLNFSNVIHKHQSRTIQV